MKLSHNWRREHHKCKSFIIWLHNKTIIWAKHNYVHFVAGFTYFWAQLYLCGKYTSQLNITEGIYDNRTTSAFYIISLQFGSWKFYWLQVWYELIKQTEIIENIVWKSQQKLTSFQHYKNYDLVTPRPHLHVKARPVRATSGNFAK